MSEGKISSEGFSDSIKGKEGGRIKKRIDVASLFDREILEKRKKVMVMVGPSVVDPDIFDRKGLFDEGGDCGDMVLVMVDFNSSNVLNLDRSPLVKKGIARVVKADINEIDFGEGGDVVFSMNLGPFKEGSEKMYESIKSMMAMVKPGGEFVFANYYDSWMRGNIRSEIKKLIEENGFGVLADLEELDKIVEDSSVIKLMKGYTTLKFKDERFVYFRAVKK